ncbi:galectin-6-like isoform X2 [Onthophagus taurus]|uniref:galectin-6-like isoform X2 n=1 Tax=Onthophagus taurus TaxID=166361 RepID=UPI000C1FE94A|nr:galectin-8-like isoform X2 [Onthophagus taurus]
MLNDHPKVQKKSKLTSVKPSPPQASLNLTLYDLTQLTIGSLITIEGTVLKKCKRFSINLICNKQPNSDIAFHFNPRMEQRYIVRNCRIRGYWGEEETSSNMPFMFQKDKSFKVDFFATEREFRVSIDGEDWCAFTYRMPLGSIVALEVRGLVEVKDVKTKTFKTYPDNVTPIDIKIGDETKDNLRLPFVGKLPQPFGVGWELDVAGRLKLLPQTFFINLQESPYIWPHPNIPLHLNPRFNAMNGSDVFVRNAWYDGNWGAEERAPVCPFLAGNDFLVQIRNDYDAFTIWSQGKMIAEFRIKRPVDKIMYVYITGDLELYNVSMHQRERSRVLNQTNKSPKQSKK